jgi:hypothetical protein
MIQYSAAPAIESKSRGVLDTPQEPVIGLAEGKTRWRSMTTPGERQSWPSLRGAHATLTVIASEAKQSTARATVTMDCFVAEPVIGRAFARPVGSSQ